MSNKQAPRRITKIKCKKGLWFFAWETYQPVTKNWDQHTLSCKDQARQELIDLFMRMGHHAAEICEIPTESGIKSEEEENTESRENGNGIVASGITLSYSDGGNCYLIITAQKKLTYSKRPLLINTPARPEIPEKDEVQEFCWSDDLASDIDLLEQEAWKYIEGDRAQQVLDFGNAAGGTDEEDSLAGGEEIGVSLESIGA